MKSSANGMTLMELLVVIAIMGLLLGLGVPAFSGIRESTQTTNAYYLLTSSLMAARSAAISRRQPVSLCPSPDGLRCHSGAAWDGGWIVFSDPAETGQPANAAAVLRRIDPVGTDLAIRPTTGRERFLRYHRDGRSPGSNVTLRICSKRRRALLGSVVVNNAGRARSSRSAIENVACPFAF